MQGKALLPACLPAGLPQEGIDFYAGGHDVLLRCNMQPEYSGKNRNVPLIFVFVVLPGYFSGLVHMQLWPRSRYC